VKIVPAFENHVLMHQFRMLLQMCAQAGCVTGIDQVNGVAECGIFDSFLMRQIELAADRVDRFASASRYAFSA